MAPIALVTSEIVGQEKGGPKDGIGLCLSGGGYRAMLFHLGPLLRLNELGILKNIARISSVSGGSITAGVLGLRWNTLQFDHQGVATNLVSEVVRPVQKLASRTLDAGAIIGGSLLPGTISERIEDAYRKHLFGNATLQDLPDGPRFVINATNVQSGALWRFSKPYMGDYRVGLVYDPKVALAKAVAASSAFPPVLSPATLDVDPTDFGPGSGTDLQKPPYTSTVVLTDGGVYDNLGLETVWKRYKTVLVSDGGGKMSAEAEPKHDWARHAYRVMDIIDNQVRSLRKRQIIDAYQDKSEPHDGAYWGIRTDISHYGLGSALPAPHQRTLELASTPTRLKRMDDDLQEHLINWGYAVCDAAIRKHMPSLVRNDSLPRWPYGRGLS